MSEAGQAKWVRWRQWYVIYCNRSTCAILSLLASIQRLESRATNTHDNKSHGRGSLHETLSLSLSDGSMPLTAQLINFATCPAKDLAPSSSFISRILASPALFAHQQLRCILYQTTNSHPPLLIRRSTDIARRIRTASKWTFRARACSNCKRNNRSATSAPPTPRIVITNKRLSSTWANSSSSISTSWTSNSPLANTCTSFSSSSSSNADLIPWRWFDLNQLKERK